MKAIKIYTQDSKYYMEDLENNTTVELTEIVDDGKTLRLPENSANRKYCAIKKAEAGILLDYKESHTINPEKSTTPKKTAPKFDPEKYLDEKQNARRNKLLKELEELEHIAEVNWKMEQTLKETEEMVSKMTMEDAMAMFNRIFKKEEAEA